MRHLLRSVFVLATAFALLIALTGVALAAYLETESGTLNCGGYPMHIYTRVHADGSHAHTILHSSTFYGDVGYVRNTYKYSNETNTSWATSGGHVPPGYYDFSGSGGFCYYDP